MACSDYNDKQMINHLKNASYNSFDLSNSVLCENNIFFFFFFFSISNKECLFITLMRICGVTHILLSLKYIKQIFPAVINRLLFLSRRYYCEVQYVPTINFFFFFQFESIKRQLNSNEAGRAIHLASQ